MQTLTERVEGLSLPTERFIVRQCDGVVDGNAILSVMQGEVAACWFKGVIPPSDCETITRNFRGSSARIERTDGVPGSLLGTSHYGKSTIDYVQDVRRDRDDVAALFRDIADPMKAVRDVTAAKLASNGQSLRAARHDGKEAGDCRALMWSDGGEFALGPHDDVGQLDADGQRDFEIQRVRFGTVASVCAYPSMPRTGGELRLWNIQPSVECRERLSLTGTGYPYPVAPLANIDSLVIAARRGDIVLINGAFVHAVQHSDCLSDRLLLTFFMGFVDERNAVWWT